MPTRRQDPHARQFRQEAFASSEEFERGILGNLVAARCHKLTNRDEIEMLWWLQQVSWREGGMLKLAEQILEAHPAPMVHGVGWLFDGAIGATGEMEPAVDPLRLASALEQCLVDPKCFTHRDGVHGFESLPSILQDWRRKETAAVAGRIVETAVSRQVEEELDFALETRSFILIEGREGIGKSEAALAWCDRHPGRAIYIRLEAGSDETTLFRTIARRIGTACSDRRKPVEMRGRIEAALQHGHLMLVLDEAHFLWPQSERAQRSAPKRVDWLRTGLVDSGVPIALISTPQFFAQQCERFRKAGWNSNQVQRRLVRTAELPETLSAEEAVAVARSYFPKAPARLLKMAAGVALLSVARLTTFSHLRKRVDFLAPRHPSNTRDQLLEAAIAEFADINLPSPAKTHRSHAAAVQAPCRGTASPFHRAAPPPGNRITPPIVRPATVEI